MSAHGIGLVQDRREWARAVAAHRPWPYLRQEQGEVLEKWYLRKDDRDIVIKQNTGGGKTVAGLLIAQSTLNEGVGRAAYLAPDTYLPGGSARRRTCSACPSLAILMTPTFTAGKPSS
jgi:hypothetical protein